MYPRSFFFQAEDGIRDGHVTGVQTCALPISRRDNLVARQKSAEAQQQVQSAVQSLNVLDPSSELGRFEEQVRRQEASVMGQQELYASSLDAQFAELETSAEEIGRAACRRREK